MNIIERISALEACENTAQVVALLEDDKVRGNRCNVAMCPIAIYLSRAPDVQKASADSGFLYWRTAGDSPEYHDRRTTDPVSEFVSLFDRGIYPQLIAS